jgi:hypothetical protein
VGKQATLIEKRRKTFVELVARHPYAWFVGVRGQQ